MSLRFVTAGESHGKGLVAVVEGLPAGLSVAADFVNRQLRRRQQGYGRGGRMKIERDEIELLSGVRHGRTLGSPVAILIRNLDHDNWRDVMSVEPRALDPKHARRLSRPRPGHADLAGGLKFDTHDMRDILERASARETAARVAVGALARLLLTELGIEVASHTAMIGGVPDPPVCATWEEIVALPDDSPLRCVDVEAEQRMIALIDSTTEGKDTLGGVFEVVARGVIAGLGSHTRWNLKLDGLLAQAVMSVPAVKAVEIGAGVEGSRLTGSQVHDEIGYNPAERRFTRPTNRAGGIEGGMTNGEEVRVRGHLKPISTLRRPLASVDAVTKEESAAAFERSDIVAVPAAGVIGEAMVAIVLAGAAVEKFGGDTVGEMKRNFEGYRQQLRDY